MSPRMRMFFDKAISKRLHPALEGVRRDSTRFWKGLQGGFQAFLEGIPGGFHLVLEGFPGGFQGVSRGFRRVPPQVITHAGQQKLYLAIPKNMGEQPPL